MSRIRAGYNITAQPFFSPTEPIPSRPRFRAVERYVLSIMDAHYWKREIAAQPFFDIEIDVPVIVGRIEPEIGRAERIKFYDSR